MDAIIFNALPTEMQQIVGQIEDRVGRAIGLKPLSVQHRKAVGNVPAIAFDGDGKNVFVDLMLPNDSTPALHVIGHEILHAKHVVLDGAPMLQSKVPTTDNVVTAINNDFAHLDVIPAELSAFPEAATFWQEEFTRGLGVFAARIQQMPNSRALRNDLLRFKLVTTRVLPSWDGHEMLQAHLRGMNIASDASKLLQAVEDVADSGTQVLSTMVRFHRRKPDDFMIFYAFAPPVPLPNHRR